MTELRPLDHADFVYIFIMVTVLVIVVLFFFHTLVEMKADEEADNPFLHNVDGSFERRKTDDEMRRYTVAIKRLVVAKAASFFFAATIVFHFGQAAFGS
jgi:hypothetical protein